ncbi:ATP-binding cassette domain-containing protein [Cryobacterium levicorallinum]|uniref:ABC transport system ATP-binding protein n=1 Tax=Cryobacterium levicorallinum TaxID=995038 RepID=A0A1I3A079_9MICO|nr:ATP-binding cassette domain-containing protein [Cryobacterium levicorallinum]TFB82777.1 ATP-binding cassette domain-containing protein [Cryobacterium levicorallinum]GEP26483.1 lipoprotein-releasing system ATP-binding protein LolD 1 [Cryobacterium levicorallinum]SFH42731.1 putative ABC transport system ATP-binding protein [Cryobacterium levicorallinum]
MLVARGLTFGYDPGKPILHDWDATFEAGEVVAVTGPSGRGKSTLLYLLGLMLKPLAGEVLVAGKSAAGLRDKRRAGLRANLFGFVFQDAALDASRTVLDNVVETALYRGDSRGAAIGRARELMAQFGVDLRAEAKPGQVSGGQAQRIALCRALLGDPRILLADEPTGNLDPASASVVVDAFHAQAASGAAVIVVTHDPSLVARCDRTINL